MNAGLSNLAGLKAHLLPATMQNSGTYDQVILDLGLGLASMFEGFCNRKFSRMSGDTYTVNAQRMALVLPRYPIESIDALAIFSDANTSWETLVVNDNIVSWEADTGLVNFGSQLGEATAKVRVTFTGGYWWQTDEPGEVQQAQPSGSTVLPDALKTAWILQCRQAWSVIDRLGLTIGIAKGGPAAGVANQVLSELDMVPQVKSALERFRRFSF